MSGDLDRFRFVRSLSTYGLLEEKFRYLLGTRGRYDLHVILNTLEETPTPDAWAFIFFKSKIFGEGVMGLCWSGRAVAGAFVGRSRYFFVPRTYHAKAEKPV